MKHLLVALLLTASPGMAEEVADLLLQPGLLAEIPAVDLPQYLHARHLPETGGGLPGVTQDGVTPGNVEGDHLSLERIAVGDGEQLALSLTQAGQSRVVAQFPMQSANPILLFFLENVVRNVAAQTGGSPYYIRNRIRDALIATPADQAEAAETRIVLHPFADDPNRARLGDFADLAITLRYDAADPVRLVELLADTGAGTSGYTETMTLVPEK
ncbi:hypothetical protein JJJ17_19995 [Paracoccus caeni]|uniref:Uncharacterized protein n=1 Tax=Paracoccus caeni TaxID=657651 RepID=A0A934SI13_9RHOB|nr:hypothetical protein [Paracoccus caeni]MBK4218217.1 hypothetical protein [Paracoccus caeni]